MDYKKHYETLIERARFRKLDCYTENHHIKPKCIGGDDSKNNLVRLTAEEHYTAHLLLVKIYRNEPKLILAAHFMNCDNGKYSRKGNKLYGWIRLAAAKACSERDITEGQREKLRAARVGRKPALGMKLSDNHKASLSNGAKNFHLSLTEEGRDERYKKIWETRRKNGRVMSEETKLKISSTLKRRKQRLINGFNN